MKKKLLNTVNEWGIISRIFHWLSAILICSTFVLGIWMHELDYHHEWYHTAPFIHKSIGVTLFCIFIFRTLWKLFTISPFPIPTHSKIEKNLAKIIHIIFYILVFMIIITGYLMSTADGRPISVFNFFEIPSLITLSFQQSQKIVDAHAFLSFFLIGLVIIHVFATIKHHFINKDVTLKRMLGKN